MAKQELFGADELNTDNDGVIAQNITATTSGTKRGSEITELPIATAKAITTADDTDVAFTHRYLYAGVAGTVAIRFASGGTVYTITMPAGGLLPIKVYSIDTASTATGIFLFN
jgi:hypothetical protein